MKKLLIAILLLASASIYAQPWKTVRGDGNLKKETRQVTAFTSLSVHGSVDVQIAYGNSNSVQVEADDNLLQYIETTVENGKLDIKPKNNINIKSSSKMTVYVSMTKINSLEESGSGNIYGDGEFQSDGKTKMSVSGSGNIKLSSGDFDDLSLNVSGSGRIDLKSGKAKDLNVSISGSGNIDCSDVLSENVVAKVSGSGNVKVNASKSIDASISGSGNLFYGGTANNVTTKVAGSGKAIKMKS